MFKGSITALITPFKNGEVDEKGFQSFVDWQINEWVPVSGDFSQRFIEDKFS